MNYDFCKPVKLTPEGAKVLEELMEKRKNAIQARQNEYLYTKRAFDRRKVLFQMLDDLEKNYEQINIKLSYLESESDVQRFDELSIFLTNIITKKNDLKESDIDGLLHELNSLLNKDNISEYVYLKSKLECIEKELSSTRKKVIEELTKCKKNLLCPHPLYAALNDEAYCVLCHKKLKFHHDDFNYLDELIKSKRLIADVDYHVASYSANVHDVFYILKETIPFDEVSNYYREMYDNHKNLYQEGIISDEYPLEDYVWDHFCSERKPVVYQYRRKRYPF